MHPPTPPAVLTHLAAACSKPRHPAAHPPIFPRSNLGYTYDDIEEYEAAAAAGADMSGKIVQMYPLEPVGYDGYRFYLSAQSIDSSQAMGHVSRLAAAAAAAAAVACRRLRNACTRAHPPHPPTFLPLAAPPPPGPQVDIRVFVNASAANETTPFTEPGYAGALGRPAACPALARCLLPVWCRRCSWRASRRGHPLTRAPCWRLRIRRRAGLITWLHDHSTHGGAQYVRDEIDLTPALGRLGRLEAAQKLAADPKDLSRGPDPSKVPVSLDDVSAWVAWALRLLGWAGGSNGRCRSAWDVPARLPAAEWSSDCALSSELDTAGLSISSCHPPPLHPPPNCPPADNVCGGARRPARHAPAQV